MVDIPGNTSTTAAVGVGTSLFDTLESNGDHDWIAVNLVAGTQYQFRLHGMGVDELRDPTVQVRDAGGNAISNAFNDDGGTTIWDGTGNRQDSFLEFTASYTGIHYVDVGAFNNAGSGDYLLTVAQRNALGMVFTLDEIAWQLTNNFNEFFGDEPAAFNVGADNTLTVNVTQLTAQGQTLALQALTAWSNVTGITFDDVAGSAEITFDDSDAGVSAYANTSTSNGVITSANIMVTADWLTTFGTTLNSYSFETYIHEIGHALGLGHGGNYNGSATYGIDNFYLNDALAYSVMSYMQAENDEFDDPNTFVGASFRYIVTPQMADIVAIQYLYGDSGAHFTGNTTYGFGSNTGNAALDGAVNAGSSLAFAIFDEGGTDTLDFSATTVNQVLNLNAESFSSVLGGVMNVSIGRGVVIEIAMAGLGNDSLIGNQAHNYLYGNDGDDTFTGGGGNDVLVAGNGIDYAMFSGAHTDYVVTREWVADARPGSPDGQDFFGPDLEYLVFADGTFQTGSLSAISLVRYWAQHSSGDYYYGYFYDNALYAPGSLSPTGAETGTWTYFVTSVSYGYSAAFDGNNHVTDYYDYETGTWSTPYYHDLGRASGWNPANPISSAWDYAYIQGSYGSFSSAREADGITGVYYYAVHTDGDCYYGYFYDEADYSYGYQGATPSETGIWSYYVYDFFDVYGAAYHGYNYVTDYYDAETGIWSVPYYSGAGSYSGWDPVNPISSATEYATINDGYSYFDAFCEADGSNLIYYYAVNTSGDVYYGYFYDDGGYGYGYGYVTSTPSESGGAWYYYAYEIYYGYGPEGFTGYNYVTDYYDYETGTWSEPYWTDTGSYSGWDPGSPITSAADYATINGGYAYFDDFWEAN